MLLNLFSFPFFKIKLFPYKNDIFKLPVCNKINKKFKYAVNSFA